MNLLALILVALAIVVFLAEYQKTKRYPRLPLGLVLLAAALIVQFVWATHLVTAH